MLLVVTRMLLFVATIKQPTLSVDCLIVLTGKMEYLMLFLQILI